MKDEAFPVSLKGSETDTSRQRLRQSGCKVTDFFLFCQIFHNEKQIRQAKSRQKVDEKGVFLVLLHVQQVAILQNHFFSNMSLSAPIELSAVEAS